MNTQQSTFSRFVEELRNRRVFRVATVYLGTAFVILEASDMIFPRLGLPDWTVTFILTLLALGLPLAISLAWTFQFTPDGLRRSPKSGEKQSSHEKPFTGNSIIIALLALILMFMTYTRFFDEGGAEAMTQAVIVLDEKSVAVLPFTNFSSSEEDAYFADGIHDDILTQLSKIRDLRVISRTTMVKYKDTDKSMNEIAHEVGAANILEGSVRRAGDQVRIVAQLIKADSDEHLWAETYDRDFSDIFAIQSDVAKKIAVSLKSTLSPEEQERIDAIPTDNMEAYDYFLRGNQYWYTKTTQEGNEKAVAMYERAVELDPTFGLAYARLSIAHAVLYYEVNWDPTPERKAKARGALERAVSLEPEHGEVFFARGIYAHWCLNDPGAAIKEFENALVLQPGSAETAQHLASLYLEQGDFNQAGKYFEKAFELEPDGLGNAAWLAGYNFTNWNFDRAEELYRYSLQRFPENEQHYKWLARTILFGFGDLKLALQVIDDGLLNGEEPQALLTTKVAIQKYQRDFKAALETVDQIENEALKVYLRARTYYEMGDAERFAQEYPEAMALTEAEIKPENKFAHFYGRRALLLAQNGDFEQAIADAREAVRLDPVSEDALFGVENVLRLAEVYVLAGNNAEAVTQLLTVLEPPSIITPWLVRLDAYLQPILDDPRVRERLNFGQTL